VHILWILVVVNCHSLRILNNYSTPTVSVRAPDGCPNITSPLQSLSCATWIVVGLSDLFCLFIVCTDGSILKRVHKIAPNHSIFWQKFQQKFSEGYRTSFHAFPQLGGWTPVHVCRIQFSCSATNYIVTRRPVLHGCWPTCMEQTSTTASSRLLSWYF